jgi:hypothetical protein
MGVIPSVEMIRQGRDRNCGVNRIVFEGPMKGPFRGGPMLAAEVAAKTFAGDEPMTLQTPPRDFPSGIDAR